MNQNLLTTKEAARYLGVSEAFLERDRWAGARIPFVRVGTRAVRYEQSALDTYIAARRCRSTSENDGRPDQPARRP
jgi:excisionase family DNA binding protein